MGAVAGIVAALAGAGATAYAASQAPGAPDAISYGDEYRKILKTQLKQAPKLLAAHREFDPQYAALDTDLLIQRLLGSEPTTREETYTDYVKGPPLYKDEVINWNGRQTIRRVPIPGSEQMIPVTKTRTVQVPGVRGLLDISENDIQPAVRRMQQQDERSRVQGEIDVLRELGPANIEALKSANPGAAKLIDELTSQASDELKLKGELSPEQRALVQQSSREAQAARGMGWSPSDTFAEILKTQDASEALKSARRSFATSVAQLNQGFAGDPYLKFFGRSSGTAPTAGTFLGAGGRTAPFNPESQMAQDIIGTNFNAQQSAYIAGQNNFNSTLGASVGSFGNTLANYIRTQRDPAINPAPGQQPTYSSPRMTGLQQSGAGALGY